MPSSQKSIASFADLAWRTNAAAAENGRRGAGERLQDKLCALRGVGAPWGGQAGAGAGQTHARGAGRGHQSDQGQDRLSRHLHEDLASFY